jgi:Flp pilus assembly CpaE family ATPase
VVANKVGAARSLEIPRNDFEKGVEMPVRHFLPFDPKVTAAAANAGKPLAAINRRCELVAGLTRLAESMSGERSKRGKIPGIRRLFGKS